MSKWAVEDRLTTSDSSPRNDIPDPLDRFKQFFKFRLGKLYPVLVDVFSPVYTPRVIETFLAKLPSDKVIINLGSGTHTYANVVNVDFIAYPNVDLVADLESLPICSASVDAIVSSAVLEHVSRVEKHVEEFFRVMKPGAVAFALIPFLQPFHASPTDFRRFTQDGLRELFSAFDIEKVGVAGGPTSALIWILQDWIAILLSLGSEKLYRVIYPITWILSPLKFLDIIFLKHPLAINSASSLFIIARKPAQNT